MKLFDFLFFILFNQMIFSELTIIKFLYKIIMILIWRFKLKLAIILWNFMKLHFVKILLSIWFHFVNFTRWVTDEITDLNSIKFTRSIDFTSLLWFWRKFMNKTCWSIFLIIFSKWHFLIRKTISIYELNENQLSLTHEFDI